MELILGKTIYHHFLDSLLKFSSQQVQKRSFEQGMAIVKNFDEHGGESRLKFDDGLVSK